MTAARDAAEKVVEEFSAKMDAAGPLEAELAELQGSKILLEAKIQALVSASFSSQSPLRQIRADVAEQSVLQWAPNI